MDYDWLVIGSGFGGSTAALRLADLVRTNSESILAVTLPDDACELPVFQCLLVRRESSTS